MDFNAIPSLLASLAGTAIGAFVVAVAVDVFLGVVVALKSKTFDAKKLPSFVSSQLGTKEALALAGLIATAYVANAGQVPDVKSAVLAAATAGASAMVASLGADIVSKLNALVTPPAAPAA